MTAPADSRLRRPLPRSAAVATALGTVLAGCMGRISLQGGVEPPPPTVCSTAPNAVQLRRLSNTEYLNSIHDLLGGLPAGFDQNMPSDEIAHGYDNNSETASFSNTRAEFYRDEAIAAANYALDPTRRMSVLGCDLATGGAACLRTFVQHFAERAFRRPVASDEVDAIIAVANVAADDPDPSMPAQLAIRSVLRTSDFLYRAEFGTGTRRPDGSIQLSGYEIATRLSYLLYNTMPSAALVTAAAQGHLDTADGVEAQLQTILVDPTVRPNLRRFFAGWLHLGDLANVTRSTTQYPTFSAAIGTAMREETLRTVEDAAWGAHGNMLDLLTGRFTYVNDALASFYGVTAPGTDWRRVDFPADSMRVGLLTQGSTLTANAADHEVLTIIRRGKWVRDVIMCDPLPPPPANVPPLGAPVAGQSVRQQLATHRANPACAGCHDRMDPIGFGLSGYDEVGLPRTMDSRGAPVDTSGNFIELGAQGNFVGPVQLATDLRNTPRVGDCMVRQVFRYTFGRSETAEDNCLLSQLTDSFRHGDNNFRQLLVAFVRSDAFRFRPTDTATMGGGM